MLAKISLQTIQTALSAAELELSGETVPPDRQGEVDAARAFLSIARGSEVIRAMAEFRHHGLPLWKELRPMVFTDQAQRERKPGRQ